MRPTTTLAVALTAFAFAGVCSGTARAQTKPPPSHSASPTPSPSPSASPTPSPSPSASPTPPTFTWTFSGSNTFIDQATSGAGTTPPEGPGFINNSPISPMSPYDWFSSAPTTPGVAGVALYGFTGAYRTPGVTIGATLELAAVTGSITNAAYWGEPLYPAIDPHRGSNALPYAIAFPTHAGQDDGNVVRPSLAGASIGSNDGSWLVRGGFFDLTQTDRFVFAPPPVTNQTPALGLAPAETLGPGNPSIAAWTAGPPSLPLLGADAIVKFGGATAELTDALLPALFNTSARLTSASIVLDRGDAGRFSAEVAHIGLTGDPVQTTTFFGANPTLTDSAQGELPTSTLADQRQTVVGVRAFFHPAHTFDMLVELAQSWYNAGLVDRPGTQQPGGYIHAGISKHFSDHDSIAGEYYRFDPRYATIVLPYGVPENIWSVAWSWPGAWLKSNYQMVDNTIVGVNRVGYRIHGDHQQGRLQAHVSYARYVQLEEPTTDIASQVGWVDGYFLPQQPGFGTQGDTTQVAAYAGWNFGRDVLSVDFVEDTQRRGATPEFPKDEVDVRQPQIVASLQHHFSQAVYAVGGYGRYSANGSSALTPVDAIYGIGFFGVQFATGTHGSLLAEVRNYALRGAPSMPLGPPPTVRGTAFILDQHFGFGNDTDKY